MHSNVVATNIAAKKSFLVANDGQFLGTLSPNQFSSDSIFNSYGTYGSPYSSVSTKNSYGSYGSEYSALSPNNSYTSTPPTIYLRGRFYGYLSKNPYLGNKVVDPKNLAAWISKKGIK